MNRDLIPDYAVVFRASGDCICSDCGQIYKDHPRFYYEWGDGYCVRDCQENYLHL